MICRLFETEVLRAPRISIIAILWRLSAPTSEIKTAFVALSLQCFGDNFEFPLARSLKYNAPRENPSGQASFELHVSRIPAVTLTQYANSGTLI